MTEDEFFENAKLHERIRKLIERYKELEKERDYYKALNDMNEYKYVVI